MAFAVPLIGAGLSAAGSVLGGILGRRKQSGMDRRKRELIDDLLLSVKGKGPYSDMFNLNEDAFNKSYIQPAKAMFRNQIAPQIQQSYIASGQQRGTGLDDTLSRAGVELDQMLNQQYYNYLNQGNANKMNAFNTILNQGQGTENQNKGNAGLQGLAGYASGDQFGEDIGSILKSFQKKPQPSQTINDTFVTPRSGFVNDQVYNPYTGVQE